MCRRLVNICWEAASASSNPVQAYLPCAGLVKQLKICPKGSKRKLFLQFSTNLCLTRSLQLFPIAYGNMFLVSWFPVETNFSILEIVSELSLSATPYIFHRQSMTSCTLLLVFFARKLKKSFSPSCLQVKAIPCRLWPDSVVKNVLCNTKAFGIDLCKRYFCSFWWKRTLNFTRPLSGTVFCLPGFHGGFGSQYL